MKFGTRFYDSIRSYLTKICKNPPWGIFFIMSLNYEQKFSKKNAILAMQNRNKIYIAYFKIFQLFQFKMLYIYYFYLKGENKCKNFAFRKLCIWRTRFSGFY